MLGDRLKELREDNNMTQEDLANLLEVTKSTISAYENNTITPSLDKLVKIANKFKVSLDYLACRTKDPYNLSMENRIIREAVTNLIETLRKHIK